MWADGDLEVTACPVRATQDPDVTEILAWFGLTHEVATTGFGASWRLAWLPRTGGLGDQDAWLLDGLTAARTVSRAVLAEELARARTRSPSGDDE